MKVRTAEVNGKTMYVLGDVMKVAGKGTSSNMKKIMKNKENAATVAAGPRPLNVVSREGIDEIAQRYGIEGLVEKVLELAGETVHSEAPKETKEKGPEEIEILKARAEYNESEARRLEAQTLNMKQRLEYAEAIFRTAERMPYGKRKHILENEGINALAGRSAVDCWDIPSEKTYAPSVIGGMLVEKYGLAEKPAAQFLGMLASTHGLKSEEWGWKGLSEVNGVERESWEYFEKTVDMFYKIISEDPKYRKKYIEASDEEK
jgi:hypothetical protein